MNIIPEGKASWLCLAAWGVYTPCVLQMMMMMMRRQQQETTSEIKKGAVGPHSWAAAAAARPAATAAAAAAAVSHESVCLMICWGCLYNFVILKTVRDSKAVSNKPVAAPPNILARMRAEEEEKERERKEERKEKQKYIKQPTQGLLHASQSPPNIKLKTALEVEEINNNQPMTSAFKLWCTDSKGKI